MIEELDRIIEVINNSNWNLNTKIRYAYLEIGKLVHKDVMFFYTVQNRLLTHRKNVLQYPVDEIERIMNTDDLFDYKVICKTSADMLAYVFKNCDIKCEIRKTTSKSVYSKDGKDIDIQHYFVAVYGDDNKAYALTLNPDLPNIQLGKKTSHFGNDIPYYREEKIIDENGNEKIEKQQQYEGDEIEFTLISNEELEEIDRKLGYLSESKINGETIGPHYTDYYFDLIKKAYYQDNEYAYDLSRDTDFYYDLCELCSGKKTLKKISETKNNKRRDKKELYIGFNPLDKTKDDWEDIKIFILLNTIIKLYSELPIVNIDDLLNEYYELLSKKDYKGIFNKYKNDLFKTGANHKDLLKLKLLNPLAIMKKELYLFNEIDEFEEKDNKTPEEIEEFSKKFMYNINTVLLLYIDKESLLDDKSSNKYITNKIIYSFTRIFDIGTKSKFNEMNLAEQLVIIKEMLEIIFRDLEVDKKIEGYDENKSAIRNRTLTTVVFDKRTKKPYYLLCAKSIPNTKTSKRSYTPILFDLTENKLITDKSMIDIWGNFYIIKDDDVKLMIENIEVFRNVDKSASTNFISLKEQLVKLYIKEATPEQLIHINELIEQGDFAQINLIIEEYTQSIINNLDIKSIEDPPIGDSKVIIKEEENSTENMDPETFELYTILVLIGEYEKEEDKARKEKLYTNIQKTIEKYRTAKENKKHAK